MSLSTKLAPVVVAGLGGVLIGWLIAPDVDAVRDDFAARFNEQTPIIQNLQTSVAAIEARIATLPDAEATRLALDESLGATEGRLATQSEGFVQQIGEQSGQSGEALSAGLEETRQGVETLREDVAAFRDELSQRLDTLEERSAEAQAAVPLEDEAGRLASEIGASGAVLLPGQAAIFGGSRLDLSELNIEEGTATLAAEGAEAQSVAQGGTLELSENCSVRLAGVASGAAYLAPENCTEAAAASATTEEVQPAAQTPPAAEAPATAPQGSEAQPQQEEPAAAQEGAEPGSDVPAEGSQAVPDQQPGLAEENAPNAGGEPQPAPAPAQ